MAVEVYFLPIEKIKNLSDFLEWTGIFDFIEEGDVIALKIHFGNSRHNNHIPSKYSKEIVEIIKKRKCLSFFTDTNVLYRGERENTISHIKVVYLHNYHNLGVPVVIAGGSSGKDEVVLKVDGNHFKEIYVAKEYTEIDGMIALTHFKGHMLSGIGGTIKNIGMGCASRKGKYAMHANIVPQISHSGCVGCGSCVKECPVGAIELRNKKAYIDEEKCIGCASCVHACPEKVISIPWSSVSPSEFQERLVEYAKGVITQYGNKFCAINFLINIASDCDCVSNPGEILSPDIGVLVSKDPVAIDKASTDLIKEVNGKDVFEGIKPPYKYQLEYGEKINLGSLNYNLVSF